MLQSPYLLIKITHIMTHEQVYIGPFKLEMGYVWGKDQINALTFDKKIRTDFQLYVVKALNDTPMPFSVRVRLKSFFDKVTYDNGQAEFIHSGTGKKVMSVRGWGHLVGTGGLYLNHIEAARIQDEFAQWVLETLTRY